MVLWRFDFYAMTKLRSQGMTKLRYCGVACGHMGLGDIFLRERSMKAYLKLGESNIQLYERPACMGPDPVQG